MATSPTLTGRHYIVFSDIRILKAPLAQSVEHKTFMCVDRHQQSNLRAAGSNPAGSTLLGLVWLISGITILL